MDFSDLKTKFKGEIVNDLETLKTYSRDTSLFEVQPQVVVFPQDVGDVKTLVQFASERKKAGESISLTARAAGTDMSGGPLTESIVMDVMRHLNHLKEVGEGYAIAEPGVYYRDFEKATLERGQIMPSYPASKDICAIGGMVANNAGGEKSLVYGKTQNYVQSLKAVLSDGNEYVLKPLTKSELETKISADHFEGKIYGDLFKLIVEHYDVIQKARPEVAKNSSGYNLWDVWNKERQIFDVTKLFVGSQGTLGITTEVTFKLVPIKHASQLLVIFVRDLNTLPDLVHSVLGHYPESFELYDDKTMNLVFGLLSSFVKKVGAGNVLKLAWKFLPEFKMMLTGGLPKLVLLAEFTGNTQDEVMAQALEAQKDLEKFNVKTRIPRDEIESRKYWTIRHEAFSILRSHLSKKKTVPVVDDIIVIPEKLPEFLPKLYAILDEYKKYMTYALGGHIGEGNFHVYSILDLADPKAREVIPEVADRVYDLVMQFNGSITGEHNDGIIRTPYLEKEFGKEIYQLFQETKKIFDPLKIFNPGKKVDGSRDYAVAHIRKS